MYLLLTECFSHQNDVRSVCCFGNQQFITASRDRFAKIWTSSGVRAFDPVITVMAHEHWVNAVVELEDGNFATGSQDNHVRIFDAKGKVLNTLKGHTGPVTSLHYRNGLLGSGSWDGTARVWKVSDGSCLHVLGGHENGVCVLIADHDRVITGSAGQQTGNGISGFQIRIWENGQQIRSIKDHESAIRSLCTIEGCEGAFASCSNDGSARVWDSNGNCVKVYENGPIFTYCVTQVQGNDTLAVACDDCCVRIWNGDLVQEIPHPCTVWCVCEMSNGDIVTGGSDGVARVFTLDEQRAAPEKVRSYYMENAEKTRKAIANKESNGGQGVDISKLPPLHSAPNGVSDGQVKMFNDNGIAMVYQWSSTTVSWEPVGEVMSEGNKEALNGETYDKVIPVEVDDARGGVRSLKLGFNRGDNPYIVAQRFANENGLEEFHVTQIVDFMKQMAPEMFTNESKMGESKTGESKMSEPKKKKSRYFPFSAITGHGYTAIKWDPVVSKLEELNGSESQSVNMKSLLQLIDILKDTSRYHASMLPSAGVDTLCKALEKWNDYFPVLDVVRIVLSHPDGASKLDLNLVQSKIASAIESDTLALVLTGARTACNLFLSRGGISGYIGSGIEPQMIELGAHHPNKNVRLAAATFLSNVNNMYTHQGQRGKCLVDGCLTVAMAALDLGDVNTLQECCIALGCHDNTVDLTDLITKARGLGVDSNILDDLNL